MSDDDFLAAYLDLGERFEAVASMAREQIDQRRKAEGEIERLRALLDRTIPMVAADMRGQPLLDEIHEALGSICDTGDGE